MMILQISPARPRASRRRFGLRVEPAAQDRQLLRGQIPPLTRFEPFQRQWADRDAHQPQRGMADSRSHVTHLALANLAQHDPQPTGRDRLAMTDGDRTVREGRLCLQ